jgi:hypothetical protein
MFSVAVMVDPLKDAKVNTSAYSFRELPSSTKK